MLLPLIMSFFSRFPSFSKQASKSFTPILIVLLVAVGLQAADDYTEGEKLFALKVKPLLKQKCFACHGGEDKIKGDLILTNLEDMLLGGE